MSNKNYRKGARFEYKVKCRMEQEGWYVMRTAGSHGIADLICIREGKCRLIQCKPLSVNIKSVRKSIEKWMEDYGINNPIYFAIAINNPRKGIKWEIF